MPDFKISVTFRLTVLAQEVKSLDPNGISPHPAWIMLRPVGPVRRPAVRPGARPRRRWPLVCRVHGPLRAVSGDGRRSDWRLPSLNASTCFGLVCGKRAWDAVGVMVPVCALVIPLSSSINKKNDPIRAENVETDSFSGVSFAFTE